MHLLKSLGPNDALAIMFCMECYELLVVMTLVCFVCSVATVTTGMSKFIVMSPCL